MPSRFFRKVIARSSESGGREAEAEAAEAESAVAVVVDIESIVEGLFSRRRPVAPLFFLSSGEGTLFNRSPVSLSARRRSCAWSEGENEAIWVRSFLPFSNAMGSWLSSKPESVFFFHFFHLTLHARESVEGEALPFFVSISVSE